jgi:hypothetical protein
MNLFWLSRKIKRNAKYHCDQHVVKMPLEAVQLLYTALAILMKDSQWREQAPWNTAGTTRGYKAIHINHPIAIWVRESLANYNHCVECALSLCREYTRRYKKVLFVQQHAEWLKANPPQLPLCEMTPIPLCIGKKTTLFAKTTNEACKAYRKFYKTSKKKFARYYYTTRPKWFH